MCVFWKLMYSLRWNHVVTKEKFHSEWTHLLQMKSRNHSQYWWCFHASGGLSSYTTFTRNAKHFKHFTALFVDPCDAPTGCDKCQTGFWSNHFQQSNYVTAHNTQSNLNDLNSLPQNYWLVMPPTHANEKFYRLTNTLKYKARQQNRCISQTAKFQPLSTGTFQIHQTTHWSILGNSM
jgi:hypothetical protein